MTYQVTRHDHLGPQSLSAMATLHADCMLMFDYSHMLPTSSAKWLGNKQLGTRCARRFWASVLAKRCTVGIWQRATLIVNQIADHVKNPLGGTSTILIVAELALDCMWVTIDSLCSLKCRPCQMVCCLYLSWRCCTSSS